MIDSPWCLRENGESRHTDTQYKGLITYGSVALENQSWCWKEVDYGSVERKTHSDIPRLSRLEDSIPPS